MNAAVPVDEIRLGVVMLCHNELAIAARMARKPPSPSSAGAVMW